MKIIAYSYRFAEEIVQHPKHQHAWYEIQAILQRTPLFVYPGKSRSNPRLDVVQQLLNTYFDYSMVIEHGWEYHPLATRIDNSGLSADYKKKFGELTIQAEIQFGNMSRWYSDIFKFQTAYSQSLINIGLSIVPTGALARRIDSNVANYERTLRELPAADLSITLPILLIGLEPDENTAIVDVSLCKFNSFNEIVGKGHSENRWRIINGFLNGIPMEEIGPDSPLGLHFEEKQQIED